MLADNRSVTFSFLKSTYPWMIISCGMLFYCYNYFLRVSPGVMQPELSSTFHITATQFGTLAGMYYWSYTPMQIPAGMIYDKFGVRFVLCFACLVAVAGLSVFIAAGSYATAGMGRLLIGLGCAFAYIGTLKLASSWLPPNRFATVAGLSTAIGMASGALSQQYLTKVLTHISYQEALRSALIAGVFLSIAILLLVRNFPQSSGQNRGNSETQSPMNLRQLVNALIIIATNKQMWLIGVIGCLLYLPSSVFLDLWGIPYLKTVYGVTPAQAVTLSNYTFYGWIISGPIIGFFSDRIRRRCMPLTITGLFAAILLCVVFYIPGVTISELYTLFFLIGFCCGAHPLCFALGKESNSLQVAGTAVAVTNMLIMAGGAVFQPVVGKLLDLHTAHNIGVDGLPIYSASDYTFALSVVPLGVAIGIFLSLFLKETYCESREESDQQPVKSGRAAQIEAA